MKRISYLCIVKNKTITTMETRKNIEVSTKEEVKNAISYVSYVSGKRIFSDFKGRISRGDKSVYVSYLRFGNKLTVTVDYNDELKVQSQCATYTGALSKIAKYLGLK